MRAASRSWGSINAHVGHARFTKATNPVETTAKDDMAKVRLRELTGKSNPIGRDIVCILMAASLHACALGGQWTRAGADRASIDRDLEQCREAALRGAPAAVPAGSAIAPATAGERLVLVPSRDSNERFVAEQEVVRRCMTGRGYRLERTP